MVVEISNASINVLFEGLAVGAPPPKPRALIVIQLPIDLITEVEEKLPPALNQRAQVNMGKGKGNQGVSPLASLYG